MRSGLWGGETSRTILLATAVLALSTLGGCAAQRPLGQFTLQLDTSASRNPTVWPSPPEVPRYRYSGELVGEPNFREEASETAKGAQGAFNWLVGLFEEPPQEILLQRPQSGVVDENGRIYVTDVSRNAVYVFDERKSELLVWDQVAGVQKFLAPIGIALGVQGQVLVADAELGYVVKLDANGNGVGTIGKGLLKRPTGLARDPVRGLLYVADTHAHDVKVFDDEGRLVRVIGHRGEGDGEFNFPTHVAVHNGELYVTDTMNSRIQVFNAEGEVMSRKFGERGLYVGQMVRPKGVAVDEEGNVYVVEGYYDHLLVYNSEGRFLLGIGGTGASTGKFFLPAGVWVDSRNRVFVADMLNGRVVVFQFLGARDG
jgi:DNA-binding beta-propeller fold protein YncE